MARKPINRWIRCFRAARRAIALEWRRTPASAGYFLTSLYGPVPPSRLFERDSYVCVQNMGGGGGGAGSARINRDFIPVANLGNVYSVTQGKRR